jgi:hypothetical protein
MDHPQSYPCLKTQNKQLTDEEILVRFQGKNRMDIHKKITPTNVPDGGYWLNNVEVDVRQFIDAYKKYAGNETIVLGNDIFLKTSRNMISCSRVFIGPHP